MRKAILPLAAGVAVCTFYLGAQEPEKTVRQVVGGDAILASPPLDGGVEVPKMIRVQVEYVELSHETLTDLLFLSDPPSGDATGLRKQVQELVKKGEAKVIETMICNARSGEKALAESINEFTYPTEYEPLTLPGSFEKSALSDAQALEKLLNFATPTSFETRNLGTTLEIEPTSGSDDKIIDLRLAPDMVWHTGETVWLERKDSLGNIAKIQMPKIYSLRTTTALTCKEGQYVFAAALSPKDGEGTTDPSRKIMVFVKCDILVVK